MQETLVQSAAGKLKAIRGPGKRFSTYLDPKRSRNLLEEPAALAQALAHSWSGFAASRRTTTTSAWKLALDPPDRDLPSPLDRLEAAGPRRRRFERGRRRSWSRFAGWTLLLREVEEMSYEKIAEATGVPVGDRAVPAGAGP